MQKNAETKITIVHHIFIKAKIQAAAKEPAFYVIFHHNFITQRFITFSSNAHNLQNITKIQKIKMLLVFSLFWRKHPQIGWQLKNGLQGEPGNCEQSLATCKLDRSLLKV